MQLNKNNLAMDEEHLLAAVRYVALNPVRAKLAAKAEDWHGSSTRAHLKRADDGLVVVEPVLRRVPDFASLIEPARHDTGFAARRAPGRKPQSELDDQPSLL